MKIADPILFQSIYDPDNLYYAWKKAKKIYDTEIDYIADLKELVEFEVNLDKHILQLSEQIKQGTYRLSSMVPVWLPKVADPPESRQHFRFSVRDQVVWLAVINIIGPIIDSRMPFWSFGNRLYMPIWKENETQSDGSIKQKTKFGLYNASHPQLYRTWSTSWPLFRRAVSITVKNMANSRYKSKDEQDAIDDNGNMPSSFKIKYWEKDYWKHKAEENDVFYATIDFQKFYPSIDKNQIFNDAIKHLILYNDKDESFNHLIQTLIDFRIDSAYLPMINEEATKTGINMETGSFNGIPTGLFVAGFLANMALVPLDKNVDAVLEKRRIGHFRFVDDHVFLAYSVPELLQWIQTYEKLVSRFLPGVKIKKQKTEPEALREWFKTKETERSSTSNEKIEKTLREACKLDVDIPSPFTTLTLKKMSNINALSFELLDNQEKEMLLQDIEHLLAAHIPDGEIKKDTRASWAASLLIRLEPQLKPYVELLYDKRDAYECAKKAEQDYLTFKKVEDESKLNAEDQKKYFIKKENSKQAKDALDEALALSQKEEQYLHDHIFNLLLKAVKENIEKPKIWKKAIGFTKEIGKTKIRELLETLEKDEHLTGPGKQYLFCTILSSITRNIIYSIHAVLVASQGINNQRKVESYIKDIEENLSYIHSTAQKYTCLDSNLLLKQFDGMLNLYRIEEGKAKASKKCNNDFLCLLWYVSPRLISPNSKIPKYIQLVQHYSTKKLANIRNRILLMYPNALQPAERSVLLKEIYHVQPSVASPTGKATLKQIWIDQREEMITDHPLLYSEWNVLQIMDSVLSLLNTKTFSFADIMAESRFFICSPENFYIDQSIRDKKTWHELKQFYRTEKISKNSNPINDMRFSKDFYSFSGKHQEKQQVYSCAVLLLVLLTGKMNLHPLIARTNRFERDYSYLLSAINYLPISSYTQAILVGALTENRFEQHKHSNLDVLTDGRTAERQDAPICIENMDEMQTEIRGAIQTLEKYQLLMEDQKPRQLVPISFQNLTKISNPYHSAEVD